jgi:hypothetical protein
MTYEEKAMELYLVYNFGKYVKPEARELVLAALGRAYLEGTIDALREAQGIVGKPAQTPTVPS